MGRGLLVGRFQPFHLGHLAVVTGLRTQRPGDPLLLGIGSAQLSYTWQNPFTAGERAEMIERALREAGVGECPTLPVVDIDRHSLWVAHLETLLPPFDRVYTNNPLTRLLFERAGYTVESPPLVNRTAFEGERIRTQMASNEEWATAVPPAVAAYLREIGGEARLRLLEAQRASRTPTA
ncbi:MAG TPA: nicotinamide-nucleotide adenylyltransferase [Thermoplasmata archaeon]|nr:nicotinamide-nucleotide adenylyltransferase [Thermoplasmata archaeon]